jgi:hypothetical protein
MSETALYWCQNCMVLADMELIQRISAKYSRHCWSASVMGITLICATLANGEIAIPEAMSQSMLNAGWRRTVDGWEHISSWSNRPPLAPSRTMHPLQFALLQGLCAVGALWFAARSEPSERNAAE